MAQRRIQVSDRQRIGVALKNLARRFAVDRYAERQAEESKKETGQHLLPMMEEEGFDSITVDLDAETRAIVNRKVRETMNFDEERLKKALGARTYDKLTSKVLDEAKIEAAIRLGEIDANVVSACAEEIRTPYLEVRFKPKKRRR